MARGIRGAITRNKNGWTVETLERRIMLAGDAGAAATTIAPPGDIAVISGDPLTVAVSRQAVGAARNIVFVAPDAPDIQRIAAGLDSRHEFVLLDPARDGLRQITTYLQSRSNLNSVHIIAHGHAGEVLLGNQRVTTQTLIEYQTELRGWSRSLAADADILLYGCDVASDAAGQSFVQRLAALTGADVAASIDITGNRQQGGDWDLEFTTGLVEAPLAINSRVQRDYSGVLPITIRAAGTTNEEQMLLQLDGTTVATYDDVGGDADGGVFQTYTYDVDGISADDVRIVFTNDLYDEVAGIDRNLRVDSITIDGVTYETEHPSVFSTGTYLPEDGVVPGFRQNEYLHTEGYFQYAEILPNSGSVIEVRANGTEGPENMELRIDGALVQLWTNIGTTPQTYSYTAAGTVTASQIQVAFTNDLWDPANGIDRNLVVDWITVDGQTFETEDPSVFSTGSWLPADGIVPGFRQSEVLHSNGHFQYADGVPNTGSVIIVHAFGFEGDEDMSLQIDTATVASWSSVGLNQQAFAYTAADTVTADQIRVAFTNDLWDPANGIDRNLVVDRITVDGVDYQTEDPSVFSTGTWLPEDGIVPGFRESEILSTDGYFQYATVAGPEPGSFSLADTEVTVNESATTITLTVDRVGGSDGDATVQYATVDGSATEDDDYVGDNGVLTFLDGETSQTIVITLLPDTIDEGDEAFTVVLSNPTGGVALINATTEVTIVDDDVPGSIAISPPVSVVDESSTDVSFTLTRTGGSDGEVTVQYDTSDGTAVAGSDYVAASGIVTFADGETSKTITVDLIGDLLDEDDEDLLVTLSSPTGGATLGDAVAAATIVDDDQAMLNGSPVFVFEGHLYLLTSTAVTWNDAQLEAEALGGNLVTINDVAEENWLKQTFGSSEFWIGFQENDTTGEFEWASGANVIYTNWATGRPNQPATDNVAVMNWQATGKWADQANTALEVGIIELGTDAADSQPTVPNGTGFSTELIASGLNQPISFAEAPDGRIFVNEKAGVVRIIENGVLLPTPFYDINLEVNSHHDRGMMGIALDPEFDTNGYVYLQYSVELNPSEPDEPDFDSDAGGRLIRISASAADPNVADPSTRVVIQDGHQMSHATHSVGDVDFDNVGNLIYTWGDGGFDPVLRLSAQDPTSPQGKLFRIDRTTFEGIAANPFYDAGDPSSIESRVWAVGIRNSWKLTVDRATGDVYMGEVTDGGPEEINVMRADGSTILNYGWPYYEDTTRTPYGTVPPNFVYESAFVALPHTNSGGGDAIVGGAVFRGETYPDIYDGRYFFGNFNQGILYTADQTGTFQQFGDIGDYGGAVDIQLGSDDHIWIMSLFTGTIERLVFDSPASSNTEPNVIASASQTAGAGPIIVTFDASASFDDDGDTLSYFWDLDSDGVVDTTGPVTTHAFAVLGRTTTTLIVSDGNGGISSRAFEIDVLATAPTDGNLALGRPTIQSETDGGAIASRAVDGNTSGLFTDDSIAQTIQTRTPLWEVDLGAIYDIGSLEIFTRDDGVNQLNNFWILISETPFSSGNLDAARNDPGVWLYHDAGTANPLEVISVGTLGRYVRIQMEGVDDILALAEVKVIAATT